MKQLNDAYTHLVTIEVVSRPSTFATAHEANWKSAVRNAVTSLGVRPASGVWFSVRIAFRTPAPTSPNEVWDLDNLIKPTLDAMEGVFGLRAWGGLPQPADHLVEHLTACKRQVTGGEPPGATIEVWVRDTRTP